MTIQVVFVITGLSTGGAEVMLLRLLERIDREVFSPHVISLTNKGEIGKRIEALSIPVEALGMKPGVQSIGQVVRLVVRLAALRPDVVHTWMYHANLLGSVAARLAGIRRIGWAIHHSNLDRGLNKRMTLCVSAWCARLSRLLPKGILVCSERARKVHVEAGYAAERMTVIPNGFDLSEFHPDALARVAVRSDLGLGAETPLIGLVARYHPQKNIEGFVQAATAVGRSRADVHFLMVGSGLDNDNSELRSSIMSSGIADRFHLLGRREDIPRVMAAMDVLVSSSHGEAFPNVLGEAMACGVPCVVTDVGDCAEMLGDTGRIVKAGDMEGLAREMLMVLDMPLAERQALGLRARQRVRDRYDIDFAVRRYQSFFCQLMGKHEPCAA